MVAGAFGAAGAEAEVAACAEGAEDAGTAAGFDWATAPESNMPAARPASTVLKTDDVPEYWVKFVNICLSCYHRAHRGNVTNVRWPQGAGPSLLLVVQRCFASF